MSIEKEEESIDDPVDTEEKIDTEEKKDSDEDDSDEKKENGKKKSPHHDFLISHGWTFIGSNNYEYRGMIESAESAYESEKYMQELGVKMPKKITKKEEKLQNITNKNDKEETINKKEEGVMKKGSWKDEEIDLLITGYKTKTMKDLSKEMKRSEGSIRNMIYILTKKGKIENKKTRVKKIAGHSTGFQKCGGLRRSGMSARGGKKKEAKVGRKKGAVKVKKAVSTKGISPKVNKVVLDRQFLISSVKGIILGSKKMLKILKKTRV